MKPKSRPNGGAASANITKRIKELGDWRGQTLAEVRKLIHDAEPDIQEEWKWRGTPVWSHDGIVCTGESYKQVVKLTFARGASVIDPKKLFNSSLEETRGARSTSTKARRSTKPPSRNSSAPRWRPTPRRAFNGQPRRSKASSQGYDVPRFFPTSETTYWFSSAVAP